ncbi:LytR/AlgR family response regulator transcription factor [Pedobacter sandarakinus]|uniref:LytR/AlgR family response regulator transcription factor n=1 Tax=Pedobacter sandarakinus TaxID=353156 RepID=UPI002246E199|nr:LytTR family DNA-binding domain-containing protein [Pedobacter sandarakinus]MCX2574179.1 LytTR family DNA-binding domain-containing protein [Pedobacter sandarakinus]
MLYNCIIVDDNEIERDAIEMHLKKIPSLAIVAKCASGLDALQVLSTTQIDIVFSDIDMPDLSGIELSKSIKTQPLFIFITSYSQYAAECYNIDAIDFIIKPATFERAVKATNKAVEYLELKKIAHSISPQDIKNEIGDNDYFFFKETKGITKLKYSDVIYIESMGDFSKLYTHTDKHVILVSLKNLEKQLPKTIFARVHKQYIINTNHIATITNHEVQLKYNFVVPISASNRQELLESAVDKKMLSRFTK